MAASVGEHRPALPVSRLDLVRSEPRAATNEGAARDVVEHVGHPVGVSSDGANVLRIILSEHCDVARGVSSYAKQVRKLAKFGCSIHRKRSA